MTKFFQSMEDYEKIHKTNEGMPPIPNSSMAQNNPGNSNQNSRFGQPQVSGAMGQTQIPGSGMEKFALDQIRNFNPVTMRSSHGGSGAFGANSQSRMQMSNIGMNPRNFFTSLKMFEILDRNRSANPEGKMEELQEFEVEEMDEDDSESLSLPDQNTFQRVDTPVKSAGDNSDLFEEAEPIEPHNLRSNKKNQKDESSKEEVGAESARSLRGRKKNSKKNRTYSLYLQKEKQKKSLQDRELERIISKDVLAKDPIKEALGDSAKIFELIKLLFMLKEGNLKSLFADKAHPSSSSVIGFGGNNMNKNKFKSLFVNSKIDGLLRKYLLTRHHSNCNNEKDEALIEFVQHFPMMYGFKTRILFFKLTAFTSLRNKYYASELFTRAITRDEGGISIPRRKIEIPRDSILEDALRKVRDLQSDDSFLEFQFEDEVGTGLGPTLEYYSLISKAIKEEPSMWRETTDNSLYPNPLNFKKRSSKDKKKIEKFFELVGTITARSLMDERLIDLPISVVFWKLVFSETAILDDVEKVDKPFHKGLKMLQDLVDKEEKLSKTLPGHIKEVQNKGDHDEGDSFLAKNKSPYQNQVEVCPNDWDCDFEKPVEPELNVEDLCLTFTLPGTENIDLVRNGYKKTVNKQNMKEYLRSTLNCLFNDAVKVQVNAFRRGVNNVFRIEALKCFLLEELEGLISGEDTNSNAGFQKWSKAHLLEHVVPDHGYDKTNPTFLNFIDYMENMTREEIRNFLMFITGSPRLPLGGLKSLRPKLTVVKRTCGDEDPDGFLPSVMTCQNYVKLPEYSSLEVLKSKMNYAVKEGVNTFNLS